jgi:hypothetical protein
VDDVALDVQAEDVVRPLAGLRRVLGQLHATGLAASAGLDLGLDDHQPTDPLGRLEGVARGADDLAALRRYAVLGEELLRLELVQIHWCPS